MDASAQQRTGDASVCVESAHTWNVHWHLGSDLIPTHMGAPHSARHGAGRGGRLCLDPTAGRWVGCGALFFNALHEEQQKEQQVADLRDTH